MNFKDDIDSQIIEVLKINAREKVSDIARKVNRSRTAVEKRINRLESAGIIKGYSAIVAAEENDGDKLRGFVIIQHADDSQCEDILSDVSNFNIIRKKSSVYGELDLILDVEYSNLEELMELKYFLTNHPKVRNVIIAPVIKEWA
ncbi:Lrp/AsnC family transcriptional regulator [Halomonas campisalis]|uniref:Lrp/AsnC family transcriptional regulator n=1 Tax=Billgrantia campisalis TaxID=74661 RepID=A0ABS9P8X1_9GAMM|nr:Lrp/AsnC family transcriptional regulator [Halomonas campisalis]MCG6657540.1 Lrp/AsnC family transcriptional regulator [Halomonas campisalis]MDR5862688.1 Lrp/AsnC family transcriptional regulator [Halomonas campisalis]